MPQRRDAECGELRVGITPGCAAVRLQLFRPAHARWGCALLTLFVVGCAPAVAGHSATSETLNGGPSTPDTFPHAHPTTSPSAAVALVSAPRPATGGSGGAGPARGASPPPPGSACGTWAMLQVSSTSALHWFTPSINQALAVPGIQGLSLRAPWTSITSNLGIYAAGLQLTRAAHRNLAIRFIAGVSTPAQYLGNSTVLSGSGGRLIPLPWGAGSTPTSFVPNTTFVAAYRATVVELAAYARANGIRELHLPWYSGSTAEIYLGPEIQSAPGYSLQNFLAGYEQLVNIAMSVAGNGLTVELPMSGIGTRSVVHPLEQYIVARYGGDPRGLIAQWNNLTSGGPAIADPGIVTGRQMYGQGDFNWAAAYQTLRAEGSKTLEVYLQSFAPGLAHAALLRQQIGAFASTC